MGVKVSYREHDAVLFALELTRAHNAHLVYSCYALTIHQITQRVSRRPISMPIKRGILQKSWRSSRVLQVSSQW